MMSSAKLFYYYYYYFIFISSICEHLKTSVHNMTPPILPQSLGAGEQFRAQ